MTLSSSVITFVFTSTLAIAQFFTLSRQSWELQLQNKLLVCGFAPFRHQNLFTGFKELVEDRPPCSHTML